jgi:molybdate transport system substrate-binding protein
MAFSSKILSLFVVALWLASPAMAVQTDIPKINVLADPSLDVALSKLARLFADQHGIAITTAYATSEVNRDNIDSGREADVFITADQLKLEELQLKGLLDVYSKKPVSKNRIALTTYADNTLNLVLIPKLPLASILLRIDPEFSFMIGDPSFQSSGYYALKALRNYEMAGELEPHLLFVRARADMHRTIAKAGGYGVMYQSDVLRTPQVRVLGTFPEVSHSPILYYGMVVAGENMEPARRFVEFLTSEPAQKVFESLGFEPLTTYADESGHLARLN